MTKKNIWILISLAAFVLIGMMVTQTYILMKTWDVKDQEFDQSVRIMLRQTAERIADFQESHLSKDLIQRTSSNVYAVHINGNINSSVLEEYLIQEMNNHSMKIDFEYAVYDCNDEQLVYGNYCKLSDTDDKVPERRIMPNFDDLDYYFVISFPTKSSYLLSNMTSAILLSLLSILSILFFIYMIYIIFRQKKLSELQTDFINNMTHEFKTPITSIKLASEGLEKYTNIKNERTNRYIDIIKEQSSLLNNQVEKVLNLARSNSSHLELQKEKIDLQLLMSNLIDIENQKQQTEITFLPSGEYFEVNADRLHLTNILRNLIDNACKYNQNNNPIVLHLQQQKNEIVIQIKDQGIGIAKKHIDQVFDKFYRVPTGDIHNVKGFGLGLYYVKNICEAHGWKIDINSVIDEGTTVTIKMNNDG